MQPTFARTATHTSPRALQNGDGTIAPGSRTVNAAYDTRVAVAWLPANRTAVFAFRGSSTVDNWLTGFQQWCARRRRQRPATAAEPPEHGRKAR